MQHTEYLLPQFRANIGKSHLHIGSGTGYYLHKGGIPTSTRLTLVDLEKPALDLGIKRSGRPDARGIQADILKPLPVQGKLEVFQPLSTATALITSSFLALILSRLYSFFQPGLVRIPGPITAKFTDLWRLYKVWQWKFKEDPPSRHEKYNSSLIRIRPRMSDMVKAIAPVYKGAKQPTMFAAADNKTHVRIRKPVAGTAGVEQILGPRSNLHLLEMATKITFAESFWQAYLAGQEAQLPALADVEEISDRVVRILAGNPSVMQLQVTNTYLVETGASRILIDTGEGLPIWISQIAQLLTEGNLDLAYILLTHWHGDHTARPGPEPYCGRQIFRDEGASIRAVFTPGHAINHMYFVFEEKKALFMGDNVLGHGFSVVQDLAEYMKGLSRMETLGCLAGYPAHGARISDLPGKMQEYVKHNEFRVQQVFSALSWNNKDVGHLKGAGRTGRMGMTLPEIIKFIYGVMPVDLV
ncbi:beta-lactamase-like protein [Aspergillus spectabilis]